MSRTLLTEDYIQTMDTVTDWKEAIKLAAQPMVAQGDIDPSYVDAMLQTVMDLGSYIVIAPLIALPHARSEGRVHKNAVSLLKLKEPVYFEDGDEDSKATVILPIACVDNEQHMAMLAGIAELFMDDTMMSTLLETNDSQTLRELFKHFKFEEETS